MKKVNKFGAVAVVLAAMGFGKPAAAGDVLSGVPRLACEAILCLSSSVTPSPCNPALSYYYGIKHKKWSDTISARLAFLRRCPVSSQTPEMSALVSAISRGAGRCDAASLNQTLIVWGGGEVMETWISNQLPDYCRIYHGHEYTRFDDTLPRYVGTPREGGRWVEARNYERELAKYEEEQRRKREQMFWW